MRQQVNGPYDGPFAQRLDLGWVVVRKLCLSNAHKPSVSAYKTQVLENRRPSYLIPCDSYMNLKEKVCYGGEQRDRPISTHNAKLEKMTKHNMGCNMFETTANDSKLALSIEDVAFLKIMDSEVYRDKEKNWVAPVPFKVPRKRLPNNRRQAVNCLTSLLRTLNKKPVMKQQFIAFMGKVFEANHTELAPPPAEDEDCWYLPMFGVYHPQKPDQITWDSLLRAIAFLIHITCSHKSPDNGKGCRGWHQCNQPRTPDKLSQAMDVIIKAVQRVAFPVEFSALSDSPSQRVVHSLNSILC